MSDAVNKCFSDAVECKKCSQHTAEGYYALVNQPTQNKTLVTDTYNAERVAFQRWLVNVV